MLYFVLIFMIGLCVNVFAESNKCFELAANDGSILVGAPTLYIVKSTKTNITKLNYR